MENSEMSLPVEPRVRRRVMDVLCDKFAAFAGSAPEGVLPEHLVSGYLSDDPLMRHRFMVQLERTFGIPIDGNRFDSARTVGELADLLALKIQNHRDPGRKGGRSYVVCYRDGAGRLVETRVRARNHGQAIEALRAEGLDEVVSVEREDEDGDEDPRAGKVRNFWTGCFFPLLASFAVAGGIIAFFWWRRG